MRRLTSRYVRKTRRYFVPPPIIGIDLRAVRETIFHISYTYLSSLFREFRRLFLDLDPFVFT